MGEFWDGAATAGRLMIENSGGTIIQPNDEELANWQASVQPIVDHWVETTNSGAEILQAFRKASSK